MLMVEEFESLHPEVDIQLEGAGSLTCIRKITELNKPCDILAVADYSLIDELMIPEYADHNIMFAGNELAIGFLKGSRWEKDLTTDNWPELIMREDVHYGRSDPNHDPSGYRTVITVDLQKKMSGDNSLTEQFLKKDRKFVRPKGTELLPLLEVGAIDLVFHYRSVLVQHNLGFMSLSDSLNLSKPALDSWYKTSCIEVDGTDKDNRINKCGEAMVYGICKLKTSESKYTDEFLQFVMTRGREILELNGQPAPPPLLTSKSIIQPNWFTSINK
jgi:molybdate/tungstate transport system substrate-binding protein